MIPRYTRPEMASIFSDESRFKIWLEVELLALEKICELGIAPKDAYSKTKAKANFDASRVLEIEAEVKHDVIAFLTNVAEYAGPDAKFLHWGMTSSDLLDTAFAVQLSKAGDLILKGIDSVLEILLKRAEEFKETPCIGRSHGIHAEPTTFGLKLLGCFNEISRDKRRFLSALKEVKVGKISGAVGTFQSIPPEVEKHVMKGLSLGVEECATQIVARDRHAAFFNSLALLATSIERFAVEVRHLQRTEVREVEEEFTKGQKGSSAMPHKRNPILSENLTGLARLVRANAQAATENIALWHERDISHSSVERVIAPDACITIDFMLHRFRSLVSGLVVYPERMKENLEKTRGIVFSGSLLVALVEGGMTREDAYSLVQGHALSAWEAEPGLYERVKGDTRVCAAISEKRLSEAFDLSRQLQHVDYIFKRSIEEYR